MKKNKFHKKAHIWSEQTPTVLSITLVLFVLGLLMFIEYHSYRLTHDIQERITFKVDLTPEVSDSTAYAIKAEVEKLDFVKQVDYISKDQAAELFSEEIGDDFVAFLGENPLYPSLMVNFKTGILPEHETELIDRFIKKMGQYTCVTRVDYQENVVSDLDDLFFKMAWFLLIFIVLLLLICVVLINNTIKIAIYSTQQTIQTMRLVGAKNSFIAAPFLRRSVIFGILGGLIADVLMAGVAYSFSTQFGIDVLDQKHWIAYGVMLIGIPIVGVIISYFSTLVSVHHFLKAKNIR